MIGKLTLAFQHELQSIHEIAFCFLDGLAFGDGGRDFLHPASEATFGGRFINGGETHREE